MENIQLQSSPTTPYFPEVNFSVSNGICELKGESYMEETYKFYLPLMNWIKSYINEVKSRLELNIKLIYLNTSSTKCILDILEILKEYKDTGAEVAVNWYYDKEDPDMIDEVEDFEIESGMKIELKEIE